MLLVNPSQLLVNEDQTFLHTIHRLVDYLFLLLFWLGCFLNYYG
ncbi:hypothetical protein SC936_06320 [Aggregatibacter actinomycetemcomitans serotype e str. SC936]|nr:hypothetical protein SC936_06320 [Aggregatibacter actinomycetemcomitans serotype e str. SC936]